MREVETEEEGEGDPQRLRSSDFFATLTLHSSHSLSFK